MDVRKGYEVIQDDFGLLIFEGLPCLWLFDVR